MLRIHIRSQRIRRRIRPRLRHHQTRPLQRRNQQRVDVRRPVLEQPHRGHQGRQRVTQQVERQDVRECAADQKGRCVEGAGGHAQVARHFLVEQQGISQWDVEGVED